MEKQAVLNFLESNDFGKVEVFGKLEGEHNYNYIFGSTEGKFVLRKSKEHLDEDKRVKSERNILKFLKHQDIEFAPRSILYDEKKDIHITTFVGSKNVSLGELNSEELKAWIQNLTELHSLNYEDFKEFCEHKNYSYSEPENLDYRVDEIQRKLAKSNANKELVEWAETKLEEVNVSENIDNPRLTHHDIHNSTRKNQANLFLIDWEFAKFSYYPLEDLADVLLDESLNKQQAKLIRKEYSKKSAISLNKSILERSKKLKLLFQLSWSLVEISKLEQDGKPTEKYREYAKERKTKYELIES